MALQNEGSNRMAIKDEFISGTDLTGKSFKVAKPFPHLLASALERPQLYFSNVAEWWNVLDKFVSVAPGVKTDIYLYERDSVVDWLRFGAVFSDLSVAYIHYTNTSSVFGSGDEGSVSRWHDWISNEDIPIDWQEFVRHEHGPESVITPVFRCIEQNEIRSLVTEIEPLIQSERLILLPGRSLMVTPGRDRAFTADETHNYDLDPRSPLGALVSGVRAARQDTTPLTAHSATQDFDQGRLFEVTIPYLQGIAIAELAKVLNDNQDLLSTFRANLKLVIDRAKDTGKNLEELHNDVLRPEIERLGRELRTVANFHRMKVAGTVFGTVSLGLCALFTNGAVQAASALATSGGGALLINHIADYYRGKEEVKRNPYYLFWEFKRRQSGG